MSRRPTIQSITLWENYHKVAELACRPTRYQVALLNDLADVRWEGRRFSRCPIGEWAAERWESRLLPASQVIERVIEHLGCDRGDVNPGNDWTPDR